MVEWANWKLSGGVAKDVEVLMDNHACDFNALRAKFAAFTQAIGKFRRVKPEFAALSLEDM